MHEWIWGRFQDDLKDATPEEIDWRPLPQANTVNAILRHVLVEAQCHLANLEHTEPVSLEIPLDFERNLQVLETSYMLFLEALRRTTLSDLQQQTVLAYRNLPGEASCPPHLLAYHQAAHLASHWGQIRTIRKSVPENARRTGAVLSGEPQLSDVVLP